MARILIFSIVLSMFACVQKQKFFEQDYSFISDGATDTFREKNDTLIEVECFFEGICFEEQMKKFKILTVAQQKNIRILKLERLDFPSLKLRNIPEDRFSIICFKRIDQNQVGYLRYKPGLTKSELDTAKVDWKALSDMFFYTYYSKAYLTELHKLKKIKTREDAVEILETMKSKVFHPIIKQYAKTRTYDMYNAGITSEIITRACILKGYSPIGASEKINELDN